MSMPLSQESRQELESLRQQIAAIQQRLRTLLLEQPPLNPTATVAYNDTLYHLQAAQEELRNLQQAHNL